MSRYREIAAADKQRKDALMAELPSALITAAAAATEQGLIEYLRCISTRTMDEQFLLVQRLCELNGRVITALPLEKWVHANLQDILRIAKERRKMWEGL